MIYNPAARNAPPRERLQAAASALKPFGWDVNLRASEASGHARAIAAEVAADGVPTVIACGGDGTLNEVINGVVGTSTNVAVIRGGTGNVFAKEIGMPRTPEKALRALIDGEVHHFDLGLAGERYFLLMCGIGYDANIVRRVPHIQKRLLGTTAFVLDGLWTLPTYKSRQVTVRIDGLDEKLDLYWLLLGNTRSYGGVIDITAEAVADDGQLDAFICTGDGVARVLSNAWQLARHQYETTQGIGLQRITRLDVITPGVPVQADGEYFGETPMTFTVKRQVLPILLPKGKGLHLLSRRDRMD
jgi:YegS/Rv2252/BmrU family lipid kinase